MEGNNEIEKKLTEAWGNRKSNLRTSFNTAIHLFQETKEANYQKGIADSEKILGYCYWRFSDYSKSLAHSLSAVEIYKSLNDKKGEADTLNSLGAVYMFQNENQKRLACNLNCLELRKEIKDFDGVSGSMNNIGETYLEMSDYENAEKWLVDCLEYEHSAIDSVAWANYNLGKIQIEYSNWKSAKDYFLKSLELTKIDKYDVLTCETYLKLCELSISNLSFSDAQDYGDKALSLGKEIGAKEYIKTALFLLSSVMEKLDNTSEALSYHKQFHIIHEEIFNEKNSQKIKDIGYQYEIDQMSKVAEIERLKKLELAEAYQKVEHSNLLIEQKNKDITDSIRYAKRIQQALLKPEQQVSEDSPEHFILFKPKDIVSGDFYWVFEKGVYLYVAVSDCTGHGVPGAFLTMLGMSFLNEITTSADQPTPAEVLDQLREKVIRELGQTETRDGMDISLIRVNKKTKEFQWAGAIRPLLILRKDTLKMDIIEGDRQSICFVENQSPFTNIKGTLDNGDTVYLFSDGYADQFGGEKGKKFKMKQFVGLLTFLNNRPMEMQKKALASSFEEWKEGFEQIDDVCVFGIKF
jgi:serine phosphatase RsbU (regulator of sigma subunit)